MNDKYYEAKSVDFPFDCLFTTKNTHVIVHWKGNYKSTFEPIKNCTVALLSTLPFKHLTVLMKNCKYDDEEIDILHQAHKCKMRKKLKRTSESKDCKTKLKKRKKCNNCNGMSQSDLTRRTRHDEMTIEVHKSTKEAMAKLVSQLEENTKRIEAIISSF